MDGNEEHYRKLTQDRQKTRFASCGYSDRFDPFVLNKDPHLRQLYGRLFESFLSDIPSNRLLDIGCGTGIYFDALVRHADSIDAIDLSSDMVRVARDYCKHSGLNTIHLIIGSAECLPCGSADFDVVIAMDLLHHVPDIEAALSEVHRVLKPGGHFLVFEPNICNPLMFVAHAAPAEERLALRRNRPGRLVRLLEGKFDSMRWDGVCALVTRTGGVKGFVLDTYINMFRLVGVKRLYPRQAWLGRTRYKADGEMESRSLYV
jgi:2-polyprenyl-3-methyl-5-hydroxy-6-metoxy-1,4-benzoquinol methylase